MRRGLTACRRSAALSGSLDRVQLGWFTIAYVYFPRIFFVFLLLAGVCWAQAAPAQPQVKVTYLNVCTPSEADQREIFAALGKGPFKLEVGAGFEVAAWRVRMDPSLIIPWVGAQMDEN